MIVQGLWDKDHPLLQIPHFTTDMLSRCKAEDNAALNGEDVESIFDIMELDDDVRDDIFRLPLAKMDDVATFCNTYPSVGLEYKIVDENEVETGDPVQMIVDLEREVDDEDDGDDNVNAGAGQVAFERPLV